MHGMTRHEAAHRHGLAEPAPGGQRRLEPSRELPSGERDYAPPSPDSDIADRASSWPSRPTIEVRAGRRRAPRPASLPCAEAAQRVTRRGSPDAQQQASKGNRRVPRDRLEAAVRTIFGYDTDIVPWCEARYIGEGSRERFRPRAERTLGLLRIALRVKLKREGLPADALALVASEPPGCDQERLTAELGSVR